MLSGDKQWANQLNLNYHPTVTINDFTFRGAITYSDISKAICAAFNIRLDDCETDKIWSEHSNPE